MFPILIIENCKISRFPENFFHLKSCESVQKLYLNVKNLTILRANDFILLTNLTHLTIVAPCLTIVYAHSFDTNNQLEYLHLEAVNLKSIPENLFSELHLLKRFVLIVPSFETLSISLLPHNAQLEALAIDYSCDINIASVWPMCQLLILDCSISSDLVLFNNSTLKLSNLVVFKCCNSYICGFETSHLRNLKRLYMYRNVLVGNVIDNALALPNLQIVQFKNNRCSGHSAYMARCESGNVVKFLNFDGNFMNNYLLFSFSSFVNLEILSLRHNPLTRINTFMLSGLYRLIILRLSHNQIRSINLSALNTLKSLQLLDLSYNLLTGSFLQIFPSLNNLKKIFMCYNLLKNLHMLFSAHVSFSSLELLDLNWNHIDTIGKLFFLNMRNLKILFLNNNFLSTFRLDYYRSLTKLQILDLSHNLISVILLLPLPLRTFTELHTLKLAFNAISVLPENLFQNMINLQVLDLSFNRLMEIPTNLFWFNRKLSHLLLNDNLLAMLPDELFKYSCLGYVNLAHNLFKRFSFVLFSFNAYPNCIYIIDWKIYKLLNWRNNIFKFKLIVENL